MFCSGPPSGLLTCASEVPDVEAFRSAISENATAMVFAAAAATTRYRAADRKVPAHGLPRSLVLHQGLPGVSAHPALRTIRSLDWC